MTTANDEPTLYEWVGGYDSLLALTTAFYETHVPNDPLIGPVFAGMAADHPVRVASWLSEVFGGPTLYTDQFGGYPHMMTEHLNRHLTDEQRERWVTLLLRSAKDVNLPNDAEFRAAFVAYLEWGSHIAVENSQPGAQPPRNMPVPQWSWVCGAVPGSRPSNTSPSGVPTVAQDASAEEGVYFDPHIKALFRELDRNSMKRAFDLWSYDDVRGHAEKILARVAAGTMPCDGPWPPENVELFRHWVESGTLESAETSH